MKKTIKHENLPNPPCMTYYGHVYAWVAEHTHTHPVNTHTLFHIEIGSVFWAYVETPYSIPGSRQDIGTCTYTICHKSKIWEYLKTLFTSSMHEYGYITQAETAHTSIIQLYMPQCVLNIYDILYSPRLCEGDRDVC